eukprot:CAMPEP_0195589242 /NCGR_PEP_ID=MMETSP0814-20130614/33537_1 /TAXON_ID=97485 /ORGANISM="Prymnesium parvum, Strain Texoma1" /LENGTH=97 /DNA_ID=CAMNT_0040728265 /DNA_START=367 /DNA_END=660 /DNA_ORIENTATION=+
MERVRLLRRVRILFPHLDRLVRLTGDEAAPRLVEGRRKDASLALQRARLSDGLQRLEAVASLPVPHVDVSIVAPRRHHAVLVDRQGVDNAVVPRDVV